MNRARGFQVSIRTILCVTLLSAFATVAWINRPAGSVNVRVEENGSILVDGKPTKIENVLWQLRSKLSWHRIWGIECELRVSSTESTPTEFLSKLINDGNLKFDRSTWSVSYAITVPFPEK